MAFFHLRTLPGYRWPPLPDSMFSQVWNAYLELDRTQWLSPAEIVERQLRQVRSLLAHCMLHVPYYRELFLSTGILPAAIQTMDDFRRLPLLKRRTYQEKNASFRATQLPAGTQARATTQTSGSSGTPTSVHQTNMVQLWWHAFYLRDLEWCNLDPTGTLAAIRLTSKTGAELQQRLQGVTLPCWSPALEPLIQFGPCHGMDIRQDPRLQLHWLRRMNPDCLLSYPANLEALASLARTEGPWPGLKVIQSIGGPLLPDVQAAIKTTFRVPVKNTYSCAETGYPASPCPQGHGLHVHAENVILEVLDTDGRPCGPGETGQVYLTHLHNLLAPLLRYEVGDLATLGPGSCACGRGLPLLMQVEGKRYPMFHLPSGRLKHSGGLTIPLRLLGGHWQHQVIQKSAQHLLVRLAIDSTWSETHSARIETIVQEFFEAPIRVDVEVHESLPLPPSGKFQCMICEI